MAGVAILLDLWRRAHGFPKGPGFSAQPFSFSSSSGLYFSATAAATAAAASAAAARPFAPWSFFGDGVVPIAHCDAGASATWDTNPGASATGDTNYIPDLRSASDNLLHPDTFNYRTKEYPIELKPLFSAFGLKAFGMTTLRSFLIFYLPLLEPRTHIEEDEDFLQDAPEERPVDLVTPFQNSLKQIIRETTVVTTRRVLERLAVHYVSQRMAWKLLKDVPKSARRKAERGMPTLTYFFCVSRTTFRGHLLGVVASWLVQLGIDFYRCFIRKSSNEIEEIELKEKISLYGRKIFGTTVKCVASLVFASIGAGLGALVHPSAGQWIGCALGDFSGPVITIVCFEKLHWEL